MTADRIPALLEPIQERLASITPGKWFREYSDVVTSDPDPRDVEEGYDDPRSMRIVRAAPHLNKREPQGLRNADFIANAPTDQARLLAAVQAVAEMHRPIMQDFITALPCIREDCECENECPTEELPVCLHCWSQLEQIDPYFGEEHNVSEVMWPCPTHKAVVAALGGEA